MSDDNYLENEDLELTCEVKESSRVFLVLFVIISFLFHLFISVLPPFVFIISEFLLSLLYLFSKPIKTNTNLVLLWIVSFLFILLSFFISDRSNQAIFNLVTILCGIILLIGCSNEPDTYRCVMKWIFGLSVFFAVGVLTETLLPNVYYAILSVFPSKYANAIFVASEEELVNDGVAGFSTNSGFSAGYIVAGLFAYSTLNYKKIKLKQILVLLFLITSLLFTGKRGHSLFFVSTIAIVFLLLSPNNKGLARVVKLFALVLLVLFVFNLVKDFLFQNVPVFRALIETQEEMNEGEDITSGRTILYENAIRLFKENPVVGIGWRSYKNTTSGLLFNGKALDTHNIYLQLLCETGILGVLFIIPSFLVFWFKTRKANKRVIDTSSEISDEWRPLLWFSFSYQTFFLLYGLTGNVLYDCHYETMYFFSCSILVAYLCASRSVEYD